jgi:hypothetical protein
MENAGTFYGHVEYFTAIWYILWPFGNVAVIWFIFPHFGVLGQEKSGNPVCAKDIRFQHSWSIDFWVPIQKPVVTYFS